MKKHILLGFILGTAITFSPLSMASLLQHHLTTTNDKNAPSSIELKFSSELENVTTLEQHLSSSRDKPSPYSMTRVINQPKDSNNDVHQNLIRFHLENL